MHLRGPRVNGRIGKDPDPARDRGLNAYFALGWASGGQSACAVMVGTFSLRPAVGGCCCLRSPVAVWGWHSGFIGSTFEPTASVASVPGLTGGGCCCA